jgi:hypothetical protein
MKELNQLTPKRTSEIEDAKQTKTSPSAPHIETPVPPQVMDPSALPDNYEKKKTSSSGKRKKKLKAPKPDKYC